MTAAIFLGAAACLTPQVINPTGRWTERDSQVFTRSLTRCEEKFPRSPCLDRFVKTAEGSYQATCKDPFYFSWAAGEGVEPPATRRPAACYP